MARKKTEQTTHRNITGVEGLHAQVLHNVDELAAKG